MEIALIVLNFALEFYLVNLHRTVKNNLDYQSGNDMLKVYKGFRQARKPEKILFALMIFCFIVGIGNVHWLVTYPSVNLPTDLTLISIYAAFVLIVLCKMIQKWLKRAIDTLDFSIEQLFKQKKNAVTTENN